ncbi:hypothetical protein F511_21236 [Dorcoceras hygrometricum]|uniref:Uncharacterized protein n=1 Tax=Dorcoceras hygrometricum TaxID=472368 RepID=A0A2Z7BR54_9LAMI|nr:hypothetical protein F511_21236 [Dorcoceras hygrometricum]
MFNTLIQINKPFIGGSLIVTLLASRRLAPTSFTRKPYDPFNTYIPIRSTTIGKSRVARDPIAMHTSWRSNSDIASVTRVSMTIRVMRTNQYNQDLGLFHSTNGNHLESPNEGSSIDHQITLISGILSFVTLSAMASSLVSNTDQVHFASVLAMDNSGMVAMFEALVASVLNGFLGFRGKLVEISEEVFARTFQLSVEGLIDINEVPKDLIFDARTEFSFTGEQLYTSCKKRELKIEYRLLSDIMAKSITVKAGSFDAVTHERFLLMTAIFGDVSVNWGRLLFKIFKDMVTSETRQAKGYAVHICILLNNIPDLKLGDSEEFPPLKILTSKTVGRYIAINDKIVVDSVEGLIGKSRVKKTPVKKVASKKRPAVAIDEQVVKKKRTLKGKAAPSKVKLELVSVALDAESIQTVEPTSADDVDTIIEQVVAETAQMEQTETAERKQPHETDVTEETVAAGQAVEKADEIEHCETDEEQETVAYETGVGEQQLQTFVEPEVAKEIEMEIVLADPVITKSDDILVEVDESPAATTANDIDLATMIDVGQSSSDEELLSIDDILKRIPGDMMLPSVLAAEPTKIKFGLGISIPGVAVGDLYKASLPKIADKGKAPLVEVGIVKGHPAREMVDLIFGDIEFLIQLREHVIDEVSAFFNSFSLRRNHKNFVSTCWLRLLRRIGDVWVVEDGYDRWVHEDETPVSQLLVQLPQRTSLESLAPICLFSQPVQCLSASTALPVKTWGWYRMPPRRRGRGRGQFEESVGQNENRRSARSHTRVSDEEEVEVAAPPVERMDVVIARFQRMNPLVFNGDESSEDADSWLRNIIGLFDRVQYDDDLRLSLVTLLLRKAAERWWRGASSTLLETGVGISWGSFCETFRQESPLYPGQSTRESSVRDLSGPVGPHSSAVDTRIR